SSYTKFPHEATSSSGPKTPLVMPDPRHFRFSARNWVWLPITFAVLMLAPALSRHRSGDDALEGIPPVAQVTLNLNAQKDGKALRFTWDRASSVVQEAERGVLWIKDGGGEQRLDLDRRQLGMGSVVYWPVSNDVNFRLEVFGVS